MGPSRATRRAEWYRTHTRTPGCWEGNRCDAARRRLQPGLTPQLHH